MVFQKYNAAISALRMHEPESDGNHKLARILRERLANKPEREIDAWFKRYAP